MTPTKSITRRLVLSVLLLELAAAIILVATTANHERHVQFEAFDANLRATSNALLGSVQEAETKDGSILLDSASLSLPPKAKYRVSDELGHTLGAQGQPPDLKGDSGSYASVEIQGRRYRFIVLQGARIIDPGVPREIDHHITVLYGLPEGRVWHEVMEAIRFFTIATVVLLGATAFFLSWLIKRFLAPIHELANEAGKISSANWIFHAPVSSRAVKELAPLATAMERTVIRLQTSFEQQRRFTSDAAHELKTDLAIAKSSLQLITMKRRTAEEYERGLALSLDDVERLEATVQRMLTLARLEQGPLGESKSCDFALVARSVIDQCLAFATLREIEIAAQGLEQIVSVAISKEDAFLLCSNVLVNALQHSPSPAIVHVDLERDAERLVLRVRDFGSGIHDEDKPYLFDAFYRGDESRSRKSGGTGLGLSICRAICLRAGGSIAIENHPDGGAMVEVRLPLLP